MDIPSKDQLIVDLKASFQKTIEWIDGQTEEHFNKEVIPGKWSIAGHLYHLIKSTKGVSMGMLMPKEGLRTMFGENNREERSFQGMFEKYDATVVSVNLKTTSDFEAEPGRTFEKAALLKRFQGELDDFVSALDNWTEEEMSSYVLPHPAMGKCTIREFVYFTTFHTDHHLKTLKEKYAA